MESGAPEAAADSADTADSADSADSAERINIARYNNANEPKLEYQCVSYVKIQAHFVLFANYRFEFTIPIHWRDRISVRWKVLKLRQIEK